ncbi:DoxX family protein [Pararobbsia alpina]|uniref:DoxX family protein n=1 Tax=Pararobbsia alpina TaxID=621374 RepID=UPI0039A5833A
MSQSADVTGTPGWVAALLRQPWIMPALRACLVSAYVLGGVTKLTHFHAAIDEQIHFGLHPGWCWAVLAIFVEIAGSLCVVFNIFTWLGAGALAALTLVAMLVANDFWNLQGQAQFMAMNSFFEHLGLIAAFAMVTYVTTADRRSVTQQTQTGNR